MFVKVIFLNSSLTTWGRRSFLSLVKLRCLTAFTGRTVGVGGQLFLKESYRECEPGTTGVAGVMHRTGGRDAVRGTQKVFVDRGLKLFKQYHLPT